MNLRTLQQFSTLPAEQAAKRYAYDIDGASMQFLGTPSTILWSTGARPKRGVEWLGVDGASAAFTVLFRWLELPTAWPMKVHTLARVYVLHMSIGSDLRIRIRYVT